MRFDLSFLSGFVLFVAFNASAATCSWDLTWASNRAKYEKKYADLNIVPSDAEISESWFRYLWDPIDCRLEYWSMHGHDYIRGCNVDLPPMKSGENVRTKFYPYSNSPQDLVPAAFTLKDIHADSKTAEEVLRSLPYGRTEHSSYLTANGKTIFAASIALANVKRLQNDPRVEWADLTTATKIHLAHEVPVFANSGFGVLDLIKISDQTIPIYFETTMADTENVLSQLKAIAPSLSYNPGDIHFEYAEKDARPKKIRIWGMTVSLDDYMTLVSHFRYYASDIGVTSQEMQSRDPKK